MLGAALAPHVDVSRLVATVLAFFLAVGVGAHALDELHGRPLRTLIPGRGPGRGHAWWRSSARWPSGWSGSSGSGSVLVPFIVVGPLLVVAYNPELFGGVVHTDAGFAAGVGRVPRAHRLRGPGRHARPGRPCSARPAPSPCRGPSAASAPRPGCCAVRARHVEGSLTLADGPGAPPRRAVLLAPLERALRALAWTVVLLAAAMVTARLW